MNQPELGRRVADLRQEKHLTQEQLAEMCEVSTRTIQRIESGEVDPRAYTMERLSGALDDGFGEEDLGHERLWLAVLHLSSAFFFLIVPVLIWSWKKGESRKIDEQGRHVLNFQVTMTLTLCGAFLLLMLVPVALAFLGGAGVNTAAGSPTFMLLVMLTPLPLLAVVLFCAIQAVLNAARSMADQPVRYPFSVAFIR